MRRDRRKISRYADDFLRPHHRQPSQPQRAGPDLLCPVLLELPYRGPRIPLTRRPPRFQVSKRRLFPSPSFLCLPPPVLPYSFAPFSFDVTPVLALHLPHEFVVRRAADPLRLAQLYYSRD